MYNICDMSFTKLIIHYLLEFYHMLFIRTYHTLFIGILSYVIYRNLTNDILFHNYSMLFNNDSLFEISSITVFIFASFSNRIRSIS
jgi:hypothetical protein